jgi:hypothetical protein
MIRRVKAPLMIAFAMAISLVVLLGYFLEIPLLINLRVLFLRWAVELSAVALIVGVLNLLSVHWRKITSDQEGNAYSFVLITSLILTIAVVGFFGPTADWSMWLFNYIQLPIESSLMALLAVILVYAGARLLKRQVNLLAFVFLGTVMFIFLGTASISGFEIPLVSDVSGWISRVVATAGARGILFGVALGTIATGLRILIGADRPYGG